MKDFKLDSHTKISAGFNPPEEYFNAFSDSVLAKLPKKKSKTVSFFKSNKSWYYAAAAVIILALSIPIYNNYNANAEEIDLGTLENYVAYEATISDNEILDLLEQEDLDKMKMELNIDDADIEEALKSNSNIEEYLIY